MPGLDCSKRALCYNPPPRPLPGAAPLSQPEPNMSLRVDSEIGRLRRVLVHRPGREIDWMVPAMMETLLFDDILDGDEARDEHDLFSEVLRQAGAEVLEAQDLLAGVLQEGSEPRRRLLDELEAEYGVSFSLVRRLDELPPQELAAALIEGIRPLAEYLRREETSFRHLIMVEMPRRRSYMHLDTVFTLIDRNLCLAYLPVIEPGGPESAHVYSVDLSARELTFTLRSSLLQVLRDLGLDLEVVPCGGAR